MPKNITDAIILNSDPTCCYVSSGGIENTVPGCSAEIWKISNIFNNPVASDFQRIDQYITSPNPLFSYNYKLSTSIFHPDRIYIGATLEYWQPHFYVYYFTINDLTNVIPLYSTQNNIGFSGLSNGQLEFKMSDAVDDAFFVCGWFLHYYKVENGNPIGGAQISSEPGSGNENDEKYHTDTRALKYYYYIDPQNNNNIEYLLIGNDGGVTLGTRNSAGIFDFNNIDGLGLYITQFFNIAVCQGDRAYYAGGTQDNRAMTHHYNTSSAYEWGVFRDADILDVYNIAIKPDNKDYAYIITGGGTTFSWLRETLDGFQSRVIPSINQSSNDTKGSNKKPILINPNNFDEAFVGFQNIYKSDSWNPAQFLLFFDHATLTNLILDAPLGSFAMCKNNPDYFYAAYYDGGWGSTILPALIRTKNASDPAPSWELLNENTINVNSNHFGITDIAVAPDNPNKLWIAFGSIFGWKPVRYRVFEVTLDNSTPPDIVVNDISEGLDDLPVNCLDVSGNSNDGYNIFIGNDKGAFYFNTQLQKWFPLLNHLPPCVVNDIVYLHKDNLPDILRIATFGYGIWETKLDCNLDNDFEYIENQSPPWNVDKTVHHNVYIKSGGSLTITARISFVEGTGIIVEPGGHLNVNGGTLTNACGSLWNGVGVMGDPSSIFNPQGFAEFHNATIENSVHGVYTLGGGEPDHIIGGVLQPFPVPVYMSGGIIRAYNSLFQNNYNCVFISPCSFSKVDGFNNCVFKTTTDMTFPYNPPGPLVVLNDVYPVYFTGCSFETSSTYSPDIPVGTGIQSNNSIAYVLPICLNTNETGCTDYQFSLFSNLEYGIKAIASTPTRMLYVDRANFQGNTTGAYLSAVSMSQITRCIFNVEKVDTIVIKHFGGLYLDYCNGYKIQDNSFTGATGSFSGTWSVGVIVNNTNHHLINSDNFIYNNLFTSLDIGILAENKNRYKSGSNEEHGLTLKCNVFSSCLYDIAVTVPPNPPAGLGIKNPQGVYNPNYIIKTDPAGNLFSVLTFPQTGANNFWNEGEEFIYYHHGSTTPKVIPDPYYRLTPVPEVGNGWTNRSECCPDSLFIQGGGGGGIDLDEGQLLSNKFKADSIQNLLSLSIDEGNTQQLKSDIDLSTPPQALDVYNNLMSISPFLSDTTMVSAVKKENVLTPAMVTDILSGNPQAAKSDTVLQSLDDRLNQLNNDQMAEVMQGLETAGAKESLESLRSGYSDYASQALYDIIRYFTCDSIDQSPADSIIYYLDTSGFLWAKCHEAFVMKEKGDIEGGNELINQLSSAFNLDQQELAEVEQYQNYFSFIDNCLSQGRSIFQADSSQKQYLTQIVQYSRGLAGIYAQNLLISLNEYSYDEPYLFPGSELKDSRIKWVRSESFHRNSLKLYPDPAHTYFIAEYNLKDGHESAVLEIIDFSGRKIQSINLSKRSDYLVVPVEHLPNNMYICKLIVGNEMVATGKIIVNK